ncbi:MAG: shikimate kinase [Treponema sp.]|nr:shikimate kinase [Treponema sp.]
MSCIILMGIKHCGKSTQGRLLSEKLKVPFFDTDKIIEDEMGMSVREIYVTSGEQAFKDAETHACKSVSEKISSSGLMSGIGPDAIIATGGGICNNEEALDVLHPLGKFVFLVAQEKLAADRIVREAKVSEYGRISNLPAYIANKNPDTMDDVRALFHEFYEERMQIYSKLADVCVSMDNAPKYANMQRILAAIKF